MLDNVSPDRGLLRSIDDSSDAAGSNDDAVAVTFVPVHVGRASNHIVDRDQQARARTRELGRYHIRPARTWSTELAGQRADVDRPARMMFDRGGQFARRDTR